jgi:hypothetical protein
VKGDGMEVLESPAARMRFGRDLRLAEARRLLRSSEPVSLKGSANSAPEAAEAEAAQRQQIRLSVIAPRTMALPLGEHWLPPYRLYAPANLPSCRSSHLGIEAASLFQVKWVFLHPDAGRGALTLGTLHPLPTEPLHIPTLCLAARLAEQNNAVINLDLTGVPAAPGKRAEPACVGRNLHAWQQPAGPEDQGSTSLAGWELPCSAAILHIALKYPRVCLLQVGARTPTSPPGPSSTTA